MTGHGGNIYDFPDPGGIIDFSSNVNPFGPPEHALSAARDALSAISRYPDARQAEVGEVFAGWLGVERDCLVFGNGASELIYAAVAALRPKRLIVAHPTFSEYESCARLLGIETVGVPSLCRENFAFDMDGLKKTASRGDMVVACQPNNPTGVQWAGGDLESMAELCESLGGYLLCDECFINLARPRPASCIGMIGRKGVVVLRALTKDFAAPGLRVGFAASRPDTARAIRAHIQPWPLNCVGEAFAVACAKRPEPYLGDSARKISLEREKLAAELSDLGYAPNPGCANFLLVRSGRMSAPEVSGALAMRGILIRDCSNFQALGRQYFRVAVRRGPDNAALLAGLASIGNR
jgi:threonine-phosphate decarboxylase